MKTSYRLAFLIGGLALAAAYPLWCGYMPPAIAGWISGVRTAGSAAAIPTARRDDADDHTHDNESHAVGTSLDLTRRTRSSIGLREGKVELSTYQQTIAVPGIVVERRGRSKHAAIAPLTGYVTQILVAEGEAVAPGQPLVELRLTHEELVQSQADLLRTSVEVDVVRQEIARLEGIGPAGLIPVKTVLERKYELQKLEAVLLAKRQTLLLHGLAEEQVDRILETRTLLANLVVRAPPREAGVAEDPILIVQRLAVERGQHVDAGATLATLVDHGMLLIEGEAFEQDLPRIAAVVSRGRKVTAILASADGGEGEVPGLRITHIADVVDPESRTLHFYVALRNDVIRDAREGGSRFVDWRFKPGQRLQLRIPVEEFPDRIVLPAEAVAQDGVEHVVFRLHGGHLDRVAVHVEHRDPSRVVVANDGAIAAGDRIAMSAAQQLLLALKNASGAAVDPHAGHTH